MYLRGRMQILLAILAITVFTAFAVSPAASSFFPNLVFPHSYSFGQYEFPVFGGVGTPSQAIVVSIQDEGKTFEAAQGDTLKVTLLETDPHQAWRLASTDSVQPVSDVVLESYPAQHQFTLRATASGPVRFNMVDDRNGNIVKTFEFGLAVKAPQGFQMRRLSLDFDFKPAFQWPFK
jgi:hypothetical protein